MAKSKLSAWINENVPDEAVWGQYYVIAHKEEYQKGGKVSVEQTVCPARDATITGKEVKQNLESGASTGLGLGLIIAGVVLAVAEFLLRKPMESSTGFIAVAMALNLLMAGAGVYLLLKARKLAGELAGISTWEELNPCIESALTEKVYLEEQKRRVEEHGEKGGGFAGYYCLPAKLALQGSLDKAKSNFALRDDLKPVLVQSASEVPQSGLELTRR